MFGTWFVPMLVLATVAVLLASAVLSAGEPTYTVVRKSFWCPLKKLHVTVAFLADSFRRDRYHDVLSCSAFLDRTRVRCDKRCLDLPEARMPPAPDKTAATSAGA
ncbi:MAG: hypothetical protein HYZ81_07075 [Nitrospinae bacterium]|nr:hypothetical protein [Nitrospinota bacterium]